MACEKTEKTAYFVATHENGYVAQLDTATQERLALSLDNINRPENYTIRLLHEKGRNQAPEFSRPTQKGYTWYFLPINNPCLYHYTGKEGQMPAQFTFLIDTGKQQDTLSFSIHPALKDSLEKIQQKKQIHVYLPEQDFQQSFHAEANHYLEQLKLDIPENSVHWTEQELLIGGASLRYSVFEERDTLKIRYHLINRGPLALKISADPFHIQNVPDKEKGRKKVRTLAEGELISGKQSWAGQESWPGELYLLADGIRLAEPDTLLVGVPLHLVRKSETALNCRY